MRFVAVIFGHGTPWGAGYIYGRPDPLCSQLVFSRVFSDVLSQQRSQKSEHGGNTTRRKHKVTPIGSRVSVPRRRRRIAVLFRFQVLLPPLQPRARFTPSSQAGSGAADATQIHSDARCSRHRCLQARSHVSACRSIAHVRLHERPLSRRAQQRCRWREDG